MWSRWWLVLDLRSPTSATTPRHPETTLPWPGAGPGQGRENYIIYYIFYIVHYTIYIYIYIIIYIYIYIYIYNTVFFSLQVQSPGGTGQRMDRTRLLQPALVELGSASRVQQQYRDLLRQHAWPPWSVYRPVKLIFRLNRSRLQVGRTGRSDAMVWEVMNQAYKERAWQLGPGIAV